MDSEPEVTAWQAPSAEKAFADLRNLMRSFFRGEISYEAFVTMAGVQLIRYDTAVAIRKMGYRPAPNAESGGSGAGRHRIGDDVTYQWPDHDQEEPPDGFCNQPAVHDGTGDCGCPPIAED